MGDLHSSAAQTAAAPAPLEAGVGSSTSATAGAGASLRLRLNAIVATLVVVFVAALAWLRIDATRAAVQEEIIASNRIAAQLLARVSWIVANGGPPAMLGFLQQLGRVPANDIVLLDAQGNILYRSPPPPYKQGRSAPPAWFSSLIGPPAQRQVIRVGDGTLTIEAEASRAILDGWDDLTELLLAAALALIGINVAVFWAVGRTLQPFTQIIETLQKMQRGDYSVRLPRLRGREAALIGESVNRLGEAIESNVRERIHAHETERRLAESREWAHRMEERLEGERREIAAELHDELGQSVTAIRSLAKSISSRLPPQDTVGREATRLIESEAARLYDAMHGMIPRLTPLDLGPVGLPDALNDLVVSMGRLHPELKVTLHVRDMDGPVDAAPALAAYRVAQEALTNAIKHSGGNSVHVLLVGSANGTMVLTVDDDGHGLAPSAQRAAGFGLTGLRERVVALGGVFEAGPAPGRGTRITAQLPRQAIAP